MTPQMIYADHSALRFYVRYLVICRPQRPRILTLPPPFPIRDKDLERENHERLVSRLGGIWWHGFSFSCRTSNRA